jgi:hypothetical protein
VGSRRWLLQRHRIGLVIRTRWDEWCIPYPVYGSQPKALTLPDQVGPCQITRLGSLVAIRCPKYQDRIVGRTAATWEPGFGRCRAAKLVVPKLRRATNPLFRRAGIDLDER